MLTSSSLFIFISNLQDIWMTIVVTSSWVVYELYSLSRIKGGVTGAMTPEPIYVKGFTLLCTIKIMSRKHLYFSLCCFCQRHCSKNIFLIKNVILLAFRTNLKKIYQNIIIFCEKTTFMVIEYNYYGYLRLSKICHDSYFITPRKETEENLKSKMVLTY